MKDFLYKMIYRYISLFVRPEDTIVEIDPTNDIIINKFPKGSSLRRADGDSLEKLKEINPDFILLNGTIQRDQDIQILLQDIRRNCSPETRVIITYYSALWRPFIQLASFFGLRSKQPESNWIAHTDLNNLLLISDYQSVHNTSHILLPVDIPVISWIINRLLSPLPFFRLFNLINIAVTRPLAVESRVSEPSVSVVVAARNEAGNIENIIKRCPKMGPDDELIFVEGGSTDNTWEVIQEMVDKYKGEMNILCTQQDGIGKGDAVRKGFGMASKDILMILDADMTVPPEDLPKFYNAIATDKGEFINGSRLVYPMEKEAMRFFNLIGNKFFAMAFSFVLGQQFRDTLCGTKVLTKENYKKLAYHRSYFGDFDPFGDFDLIFGAARMGLKIVEVPIKYRDRTYGATNISRWSHGVLLLKMVAFAARKIKFI